MTVIPTANATALAAVALHGAAVPLSNEPCTVISPAQQALTARYLLPEQPALEAFFLALRMQVEPALRQRKPPKPDKPFPLGQCLEITQAVQQRLRMVGTLRLQGLAEAGRQAYVAFCAAGGSVRHVWGDLRGQFFQNAFQLGGLYVDVSNDTVVPTKPRVEVLPFAAARLVPVADFHHFARIAERYWQGHAYPNHVLPGLAPFFPVLYVAADGAMRLESSSAYLLGLALRGRFASSASMLRGALVPADVFGRARTALANAGLSLAASPVAGREAALRACAAYRTKRWYAAPQQIAKAADAMVQANRRLALGAARHVAAASSVSPLSDSTPFVSAYKEHVPMSTITINGHEYSLDQLSSEARQQLDMLQACDQRLRELQRDTAITQTARNAYAAALQAMLPVQQAPAGGGALKP